MTPAQFKAWRTRLSFSQEEAAQALGISKGSVQLYEAGRRREDGRAVLIPKTVALACAAVAYGLPEYGGPETDLA